MAKGPSPQARAGSAAAACDLKDSEAYLEDSEAYLEDSEASEEAPRAAFSVACVRSVPP